MKVTMFFVTTEIETAVIDVPGPLFNIAEAEKLARTAPRTLVSKNCTLAGPQNGPLPPDPKELLGRITRLEAELAIANEVPLTPRKLRRMKRR